MKYHFALSILLITTLLCGCQKTDKKENVTVNVTVETITDDVVDSNSVEEVKENTESSSTVDEAVEAYQPDNYTEADLEFDQLIKKINEEIEEQR